MNTETIRGFVQAHAELADLVQTINNNSLDNSVVGRWFPRLTRHNLMLCNGASSVHDTAAAYEYEGYLKNKREGLFRRFIGPSRIG